MNVIKKAIAIICCLVVGSGNVITVHAKKQDYITKRLEKLNITTDHVEKPDHITEWLEGLNIVYEDSFYRKDGVYRIEALPAIMRAFGLDDEIILSCPPYYFSSPFADIKVGSNLERDYTNKLISWVDRSYVLTAVGYGWIEDTFEFRSFDNITADEALGIMARFIEHKTTTAAYWPSLGAWGEDDYTHQYAQEKGLLLKTDRFYENGDVKITTGEFKVLLYRLMNQPAFWYFRERQCYDFERSKTYADIARGNYPESGRYWGTQEEQGIFPDDEQYVEYKE